MRTFYVAALIAVFLLSTAIGIQAQNKPTLESYINAKMDVNLQGTTMPEMGLGFDRGKRLKDNLLPQGFKNIFIPTEPKASKQNQFKSGMDGNQLLDSTITETWDTITNQWVGQIKEEYAYNANGNKILDISYKWDTIANQWNNYDESIYEYTYDANGNTILYYIYNSGNMPWSAYNHKYEYTYDGSGNQTLYLHYLWDTTTDQWDFANKSESTYDTKGNKTSNSGYRWDETTSQWVGNNYIKEEWTYDTNDSIVLHTIYDWNVGDTNWIPYSKEEFTFDSRGDKTLYVAYGWNKTTNHWEGYLKEEYFYNDNGKLTIYNRYNFLDLTSSEWLPYDKNEYIYDTNGNLILDIYYFWDVTTSQLLPYYKHEKTYDANGNKTSNSGYRWDVTTSHWLESDKGEYTYDANGNMILSIEISLHWECGLTHDGIVCFQYKSVQTYENKNSVFYNYARSDSTNDWVATSKTELTFDFKGNGIESHYNWDNNTSQWIANSKTTYYYSDHSITNTTKTPETHLSVYPNPAKEFIVFDCTTIRESTITIFDIQGKKVIEQRLNESHQVGVQNLSKGLYLYRLDDGVTIYTGKVIKE